jgi:Ser-tRNA(Ala) deacylase AlaX
MAGRHDLKPSKGYHFAEGSYVEYVGDVVEKDRKDLVEKLNAFCAHIINTTPVSTPVFKKVCTYDEANHLLGKAGGVPPYIPKGQSLRVLKLTENDAGCPCGGTHVEHVKDIAKIDVTKITKKGKSIQVKYEVC